MNTILFDCVLIEFQLYSFVAAFDLLIRFIFLNLKYVIMYDHVFIWMFNLD